MQCTQLQQRRSGNLQDLCYLDLMEEGMSQTESESGQELVVVSCTTPARIPPAVAASVVVPAFIVNAGHAAGRRFLEFSAATSATRIRA